jgi:hypothetical protein
MRRTATSTCEFGDLRGLELPGASMQGVIPSTYPQMKLA